MDVGWSSRTTLLFRVYGRRARPTKGDQGEGGMGRSRFYRIRRLGGLVEIKSVVV